MTAAYLPFDTEEQIAVHGLAITIQNDEIDTFGWIDIGTVIS